MTIYIASDHAGFGLKSQLIAFLRDKQFEVESRATKGALAS